MTSLEFALIATPFILLLLGIPAAGALLWAKGAVQQAASQTARCAAVGSTQCTDRTAYVALILNEWGAGGILPSPSVTARPATTCNGVSGTFISVAITGAAGAGFISPFSDTMLTATACYPRKP